MGMDLVKEKKAIEILKCFEPADEPYYLCYSGGKDSDCIRILAKLSGVKHELHHNLTSVDAPETINYIKTIPDVIIDKSYWNRYSRCAKLGEQKTMWNLIPHKLMAPTRIARYCCSELKEHGGVGRLKITGVRASESTKRLRNAGVIKILGKEKTNKKYLEQNAIEYGVTPQGGIVLNYDNSESRRVVEHCFRTSATMINPINDWSDSDVWEFLHHYGVEGNPLYKTECGRIGCIGCPMQGPKGMKQDFVRYPKYRDNYVRAFARMLIEKKKVGNTEDNFKNGVDVLKWWVQDDYSQLRFFEDEYLKDIPDDLFLDI